MNGNVIRTITIRGQSEGLDKLTADINKLATAQENVAVVSEQSAKRVLSLDDAWKRQTLRLDEAARAQANIARETKVADAALREGLATQTQHAQRLEQINQRYATAATATKELGTQTGLARHELVNLGRQAQDVGVSLASGQSPFTVLVQQGAQIADVFIASGKSVSSFFDQAVGWAGRFLLSTTGIITAIGAVGAAIGYMAYQFLKSSTTVEEALEKQKSLMEATKTSIGELIDAQIKLQSVQTTHFETLKNQEDLQQKLIKSASYLAEVSARRTSPLQDIGAALGIGPAADPSGGFAKITAAVERLKAAAAAGKVDVVEFRNEVAGAGEAARISDPAVATFAQKILNLSLEALNLETSLLKARAALQSVAQTNLNNLGAKEAAEHTERLAVAATKILNTLPGITVETAKTLANLTDQMTTQERNNTMVQLEGDFRKINATYQEKINELLRQGLILTTAVADAEQNRQIAMGDAVKNAAALNEHSRQAAYEAQKGRDIPWAGAGSSGGSWTGSPDTAPSAPKQSFVPGVGWTTAGGTYSDDFIGTVTSGNYMPAPVRDDAVKAAVDGVAGETRSWGFWAKTMAAQIEDTMNLLSSQFAQTKGEFMWDPGGVQTQKGLLEEQVKQLGYGKVVPVIIGGELQRYEIDWGDMPKSAAQLEGEKLVEAFLKSVEATNSNTDALNAMTDVLSPFYSSDPRKTALGFRAFAGGGIMTEFGELPLKQYQGGGMATSPQVAVFGEGSTPEAYVPAPGGQIPVVIKTPANNNQRPITVNINIRGNADGNTVAALKSTAFQQAQAMRRVRA